MAQRSVAFRFRAAEHEKERLFFWRVHRPGGGRSLVQILDSRCCGIDVHKDSVTACVLIYKDKPEPEVRKKEFATHKKALGNLRLWLHANQVTQVAMESTGVYGKPVWQALEGNFALTLANPFQIKTILSLYLKRHRSQYYELLTRVRTKGDWEQWLEFFLTGVKETAEQAFETAKRILHLIDTDRKKIEGLGRAAASALRVFQIIQTHPIISASAITKMLNVSFPTAAAALEQLSNARIVREITGKERHRVFAYSEYLELLNEDTNPNGQEKTE